MWHAGSRDTGLESDIDRIRANSSHKQLLDFPFLSWKDGESAELWNWKYIYIPSKESLCGHICCSWASSFTTRRGSGFSVQCVRQWEDSQNIATALQFNHCYCWCSTALEILILTCVLCLFCKGINLIHSHRCFLGLTRLANADTTCSSVGETMDVLKRTGDTQRLRLQ